MTLFNATSKPASHRLQNQSPPMHSPPRCIPTQTGMQIVRSPPTYLPHKQTSLHQPNAPPCTNPGGSLMPPPDPPDSDYGSSRSWHLSDGVRRPANANNRAPAFPRPPCRSPSRTHPLGLPPVKVPYWTSGRGMLKRGARFLYAPRSSPSWLLVRRYRKPSARGPLRTVTTTPPRLALGSIRRLHRQPLLRSPCRGPLAIRDWCSRRYPTPHRMSVSPGRPS